MFSDEAKERLSPKPIRSGSWDPAGSDDWVRTIPELEQALWGCRNRECGVPRQYHLPGCLSLRIARTTAVVTAVMVVTVMLMADY